VKEEVKEALILKLFRDCLVDIKSMVLSKATRTNLMHYINAWIMTIDENNEATKKEADNVGKEDRTKNTK